MLEKLRRKSKIETKGEKAKGGAERRAEKTGELDEITKKEIFSHLDEQGKEISDILKNVGDKLLEEKKEKLETLQTRNVRARKQLEEGRLGVDLVYMISLPLESERRLEKLVKGLRESVEIINKDPKLSVGVEKKLFEKQLFFKEKELEGYQTKREDWVKKLSELEKEK